jgi:hypothetical protein
MPGNWKTVGEPEDLGRLLYDYDSACADFNTTGTAEDRTRLDKLTERITHHPAVDDVNAEILASLAPVERNDALYNPGIRKTFRNMASDLGASDTYGPANLFGREIPPEKAWTLEQERFDRQKVARAALPDITEVRVPGSLIDRLDAMKHPGPDAETDDRLAADEATLAALDKYASQPGMALQPGEAKTLLLRTADVEQLHNAFTDPDYPFDGLDVDRFRDTIPASRESAETVRLFEREPQRYENTKVFENPEIAVYKAMAHGDMSPVEKLMDNARETNASIDTAGMLAAVGRVTQARDAAGLSPDRGSVEGTLRTVAEDAHNPERARARNRALQATLFGEEDAPYPQPETDEDARTRRGEQLVAELGPVLTAEADHARQLDNLGDRERIAAENTVAEPTRRYNEIMDELREMDFLDADTRRAIGDAHTEAALGNPQAAASKLAEATGFENVDDGGEPGWGTVKMNRTHVFRDAGEKGWQRRPKGDLVDRWRPVADIPPSAVNVAPGEAAAALGGRCILCGAHLKDSELHGGYGSSCIRKVGGS